MYKCTGTSLSWNETRNEKSRFTEKHFLKFKLKKKKTRSQDFSTLAPLKHGLDNSLWWDRGIGGCLAASLASTHVASTSSIFIPNQKCLQVLPEIS